MNKETISIGIVLFIIAVIILLVLRKNNSNNENLLYLEYQYNDYETNFSSIYLDFKTNIMQVYYKNKDSKKIRINKKLQKELTKTLAKYDVYNWDSYKKYEVEDGDNTTIYYKTKNGERKHICKEQYPTGKDKVFNEIKILLENNL